MTAPASSADAGTRARWKSPAAVLWGFLAVAILSLGTDQLLHVLGVYPPWGQPMWDNGLNALALSYRVVYSVLGSYITARTAPHTPIKHVWVGAWIGFTLSAAGAAGASTMNVGPMWYPILLAVSVFPCAWLAGVLYRRGHVTP